MSGGQAYVGTARRTFQQAIVHLLETGYALLGSDRVLKLMATDVKALADQFYPLPEHIQPGWMVFTGVKAVGHKAHPAQSAADYELLTLAWPVLLAEDLEALAKMPKGKAGKDARQALLQKRIRRIIEYGWQHPDGPILLTLADLGAMLNLSTPQVSQLLAAARQATGKPLLTKGSVQRTSTRSLPYMKQDWTRPTSHARVNTSHPASESTSETMNESKSC